MSRVALVTGSTSGIGLGIARALAQRGHNLLLHGFGDTEHVKALERDIQSEYGVKAHHLGGDLASSGEVASLITEAKTTYDRVDILVNNAGFQHVSPIEQFSADTWRRMLAVMVTAPFLLTQALLPGMRQRGWGRVVNVSSAHGLVASPNKAAYVTAKHAILGLTKVVALETAGSGVTCNAICPGFVDTPILQGQVAALAEREHLSLEEAQVRFLGQFHATGKPVGIDHLGEAVCFLCSEAASQMTGASLVIDGGSTAK